MVLPVGSVSALVRGRSVQGTRLEVKLCSQEVWNSPTFMEVKPLSQALNNRQEVNPPALMVL